MNTITLRTHFDGDHIVLDEPFQLKPNTELIITVLPQQEFDEEREAWYAFALQVFEAAYGDDEPDYDSVPLKETNHEYKGG